MKQWNFAKLQRYQLLENASAIRLGLKTWDEDKLRGTVYDERSSEHDFLALYAKQFDTVELHATYYENPTPYDVMRLKKKVEDVNPNFRFCPLVPRVISHESVLNPKTRDFNQFLYALENFDEHLGSVILQLPESFASQQLGTLRNFLACWPGEIPILLDFRHRSWFDNRSFDSLLKGNVGLLVTDDIGLEKNHERFVTGENLAVRFIGRSKLERDDQRLALWIYRMNEFGAMGIRNTSFFYYEQPELCLGTLQKMAKSIGGRVRVPEAYDKESDQLAFF